MINDAFNQLKKKEYYSSKQDKILYHTKPLDWLDPQLWMKPFKLRLLPCAREEMRNLENGKTKSEFQRAIYSYKIIYILSTKLPRGKTNWYCLVRILCHHQQYQLYAIHETETTSKFSQELVFNENYLRKTFDDYTIIQFRINFLIEKRRRNVLNCEKIFSVA